MPLTATIAPARSSAAAAATASRRLRAAAAPTSRARGPQSGQAFGWAWKRRSARVVVLAPARGAHREAGHRRQRPVVGDAAHDREARAAVRAVDERVAVAAVGGVEELGEAVVAGRGVGGDQRVRRAAARRSRRSRSRARRAAGDVARADALDRASGGASLGRRGEEALDGVGAAPSASISTPRASLRTKPGRPQLGRQAVDEGPEPDALHDALDPHAPRGRRGGATAHAGSARQLAQHVHALACASWIRGMCSRARDDDVVGEALGGDPAAVVADERDRRQPAAARLGQRGDHVRRAAAGREREQRVARRGRRR